MIWCKNATDYRRICFNEAVVFLNMSISLHTRVAAGTHLTDGKFLKLTGNREKFMKLRGITGITGIPVTSNKRRVAF